MHDAVGRQLGGEQQGLVEQLGEPGLGEDRADGGAGCGGGAVVGRQPQPTGGPLGVRHRASLCPARIGLLHPFGAVYLPLDGWAVRRGRRGPRRVRPGPVALRRLRRRARFEPVAGWEPGGAGAAPAASPSRDVS
nr:hypothetical protein GCM10025732_10710 [Glycomyces mayteni]